MIGLAVPPWYSPRIYGNSLVFWVTHVLPYSSAAKLIASANNCFAWYRSRSGIRLDWGGLIVSYAGLRRISPTLRLSFNLPIIQIQQFPHRCPNLSRQRLKIVTLYIGVPMLGYTIPSSVADTCILHCLRLEIVYRIISAWCPISSNTT